MIACPRCRTIQPASNINTGGLSSCPGCDTPLRADVYRAISNKQKENTPLENILVQGDAECFEHPGKKAMTACDTCGRLLCNLCRVELGSRNICMRCLQSGRDKNKISTLQNRRILNDAIAFHLAFWGALTMSCMSLVTASAAIFFVIRHWKAPAGILKKRYIRSIIALLLAVGQFIGWCAFFIGIYWEIA